MEVRYIIYKKESKSPLGLVYDYLPFSPRKSAVENKWTTVCKRKPTPDEIEENISNRRFTVFYYKDIDAMVNDDLKYGIETPMQAIEAFEQYLNKKRSTANHNSTPSINNNNK